MCWEPRIDNKTDTVGQTGEKDYNLFFTTHFFVDEEERFPLALLEEDMLFVTLFVVLLVDEVLEFFIDGIGVLDGFIDEISSLLANNFSKLEIAWTSIITITQNIFLGTSLH